MKILVVSNYRGFHTCRPEAEIFIGLQKKGFDVTVITYPDADYIPKFESAGIKVIPQHPTKRYDRRFIRFLKNELQQGQYDILQLYNNKAISNGVRAAKHSDVKVVIYRGAAWNMSWLNPVNYLKFYHPRVDYVICNSDEIRSNFERAPFFKSSHAITIFKGHDVAWYASVVPLNIREELGIPSEDLLLVNVANNRKVKAIPDLMKAMKYFAQHANVSLLLIGEKMNTHEIVALAKGSGRAEKIHFLGFRKDSISIVASCDVFVLPSVGGEALTKSVMEAMALGVVPVISDIAGNRPLVDEGKNGLIFKKSNPEDLAEKLRYIYNHQDKLPMFSNAAIQKIKTDLNSQQTINQYESFYQSIL